MIDIVRGLIFGGDGVQVALVAPNGNVQRQGQINSTSEARAWGEAEVEKLKDSRTGDGKTLREWPEVFDSIYGTGKWEVRILQ